MAAILSLTGLTKRYGALIVTDALDLDVEEGEALGIIGPNGAGKTSLFNLVTGTVAADAGSVRLAGRDVTRLSLGVRDHGSLGSRTFAHEDFDPGPLSQPRIELAGV